MSSSLRIPREIRDAEEGLAPALAANFREIANWAKSVSDRLAHIEEGLTAVAAAVGIVWEP